MHPEGGSLRDIVERKLNEDDAIGPGAGLLVLAALDGALAEALRDEPPLVAPDPDLMAREASSTYLASLAVEGFRGVGPRSEVPFAVGPGLTVIAGRNGSGKSSFAEALEFLLTGTSGRWAGRPAEWREGWRNLHHKGQTAIEATLSIEGTTAPTTVACRWEPSPGSLDQHETFVQTIGKPQTTLDALGWDRALVTYRPLLSHNELGSLFNATPSARFDAMSALLGLELVSEARASLREARLERQRAEREVQSVLSSTVLPLLAASEDERAATCQAALEGSEWDLDSVELILVGALGDDSDASIDLLRRLLALELKPTDTVTAAVADLRDAATALARVAGSAPQRAERLGAVLERALALHSQDGDQRCPVCGAGTLDSSWRTEAEEQIESLRAEAEEAQAATNSANAAVRRAQELLLEIPSILKRGSEVAVDTDDLLERWTAWTRLPERPAERALGLERLADHHETSFPPLRAALERMHAAAAEELERREDAWRPVAARLREWLPKARSVGAGRAQLPDISAAEHWLDEAEESLRAERFQPIAERATAIWEVLRQSSNISLDTLALAGAATRRRLELSVSIDGVEGAALAVMSQGELNALALSLFLPRALMQDSPFRFVVIDDPVQAMDPSKVDGLARVLEEVARERQVIVLTHDDRLPEAIRRLEVPATLVELTRRPDSVVECRRAMDPIERYLDDARALLLTDGLPDEVAARVVPGFCRLALEAACTESVRRRRLGRGEKHADVEDLLTAPNSLVQRLALVLFDEATRGGEAVARLNQRWGTWAGDVAATCNRGSHRGLARESLDVLVRDSDRLARELRKVS